MKVAIGSTKGAPGHYGAIKGYAACIGHPQNITQIANLYKKVAVFSRLKTKPDGWGRPEQ